MRLIHICWKLSAFTGNALSTSANAASQARNSGRRYSAITQPCAYTTRSDGTGCGECAGYKWGVCVSQFGAGMAGAGQGGLRHINAGRQLLQCAISPKAIDPECVETG